LQEEQYVNTDKANQITTEQRKRVNRIKMTIIIIIIIMMILPTVLCIVLGIQVSRLQKNVNKLMEMHGSYEQSLKSGKENYAYAAPKPIIDDITKLEENKATEANDIESKSSKKSTNHQHFDDRTNQINQNSLNENLEINEERKILEDKNQEDNNDNLETRTNQGKYEGKTVYLTFDDGPSIYTNEILDILAEYNVKATFFVIGKTDKVSKEIYQRIEDEGHAIGMHSYSHDYNEIYNSVEDFDKDFTKLWDLLYDIIGYRPRIFRFPGGSANWVNPDGNPEGMEKFIRYLNENKIVYFDWNVVNKDATGVEYTKEQLIDNVLTGVERKERSIVLMHDSSTKGTTVASLAELVETLLSEGAVLLPLDEDVLPIQQIEADSIQ